MSNTLHGTFQDREFQEISSRCLSGRSPRCFDKRSLSSFTSCLDSTCDVKEVGYGDGTFKLGNMRSGAFKHPAIETVKERGVVSSSLWEENGRATDIGTTSGSDSSNDSEDEEETEEEKSDSDSDSSEEEEEEEEEEEGEGEGEEEEHEDEDEDEGRTILVSVKDSQNPASKLVGRIELHKCSNHKHMLKAIRKIWANYTKMEFNDEADDDHVTFENAWPGYTLKYYSYAESPLPTLDAMGWDEVTDMLGSILAKEGEEEEENTIPIKLIKQGGNLETIGSLNLDQCHDHKEFVAFVHGAWVNYTRSDPRPLDTINENTAWPGFKVTYLQQGNAGSWGRYPLDPGKMSWTDVENLLYEIIVKKEERDGKDEGDEGTEDSD